MSSRRKGQSQCCNCERWINNNAKTEYCTCGEFLGGDYVPKEPKVTTLKISDTLFSVVKNRTGPTIRIFVDIQEGFCEDKTCSDRRRMHINSGETAESFSCDHIEKCKQQHITPHTITLNLENVQNIVTSDCFQVLSKFSTDNTIKVRSFENFLVVDSFSDKTRQLPTAFCHVKDKKCVLQGCKSKSRIHTLAVNNSKMCLHELVAFLANPPENIKPAKRTLKINHEESVKQVMDDVIEHLPKLHESDKCNEFLKMEKTNMEDIRNIAASENLLRDCKCCVKCGEMCEDYLPNQKTDSYMLTLGSLEIINIPAFVCTDCNIVQYPKLCDKGYIVLHNKLAISFAFMADVYNLFKIGGAVVAYLENKLLLLANQAEIKLNSPKNLAVRIEKFVIAVQSSLINTESLNAVMCLLCGSFPKVVSSDGEVKDSSEITEGMVYEKTDDPPPSLESFLRTLQLHVAALSFFQNVPPLKINMLNLPHIMAPKLLGIQQNTEANKRTQFKTVDMTNVDLHKIVTDVRNGKLNPEQLNSYSNEEIFAFAKNYDIDVKGKTGTTVKGIILDSYKRILAGESNCHQYTISNSHQYTIQQKRTGGWMDMWCEHLFKVGAMVLSRQEGVSNAADLILSLKRMPVLHVHDDPCTLVSHLFLTKPDIASVAYGDRRGCFIVPRDDVKADTLTIPDVPDILPLKHSNSKFDETAVTDGGTRHPDTGKEERYVTGHRLQLKSHKKISCTFHVLDLVKSGTMVDSLDQEGLNVKRKYGRVQQDRHRNFAVCFLFNYILDFDHNFTKFTEQKKSLGTDNRDQLSWRAVK